MSDPVTLSRIGPSRRLPGVVTSISIALNLLTLAYGVYVIEGRGGIAYIRASFLHDATAQVDNGSLIRESLFESMPKQLRVRPIVFLGDSLTAHCEWRELFGSDTLILNRGIGGDTSAGVLARIAPVAALHPLAVFLMIGANDPQSLGYSPEQNVANQRAIIDAIHRQSPDTTIYLQSVLPSASPKFVRWGERVNELLQPLADGRSVIFINLRPAFLKDGLIRKDYTTDGLHLNGAGYQSWKAQIDPIIKELSGRQGKS